MKNILVGVVLSGVGVVGATDVEYWGGWEPTTVKVGDGRNGFVDEIEARRRLVNPDSEPNAIFKTAYVTKVPEEDRYILGFGVYDGRKPHMILQESTDEGETWKTIPFTGEDPVSPLGLGCVGNGIVLAQDGRFRSEDNGRTWTYREQPVESRFGTGIFGWDPPLIVKGGGGRHLLATGARIQDYARCNAVVVPMLRESFDAGLTWTPWRGVAEFPAASEVAISYNAKGEILAGMRGETTAGQPDDHYSDLKTSWSSDGGKTWSKPIVAAGSGRHHPCFAVLPDGRVVLTYVVRRGYPDEDGKHAYGVEAVISYDDGHTWDTAHRYILAKWTNDCVFIDTKGKEVEQWHHMGAAQCTSTHYLPREKCLMTFYGTDQNRRRIMPDGRVVPRQIAQIKWMPMRRESYSNVPAPVAARPDAEAIRQKILKNRRWAVNYVAKTGYPDGGWVDRYPRSQLKLKDGWLELHHDHPECMIESRSIMPLEMVTRNVALRAKLRIPNCKDDGEAPGRLSFASYLGTGADKFFVHVSVDKDLWMRGNVGSVELPVEAGQEFVMTVFLDKCSRTAMVWCNGKLVQTSDWTPNYISPEKPTFFYLGAGSRNVGGSVDLAYVQFGEIE